MMAPQKPRPSLPIRQPKTNNFAAERQAHKEILLKNASQLAEGDRKKRVVASSETRVGPRRQSFTNIDKISRVQVDDEMIMTLQSRVAPKTPARSEQKPKRSSSKPSEMLKLVRQRLDLFYMPQYEAVMVEDIKDDDEEEAQEDGNILVDD